MGAAAIADRRVAARAAAGRWLGRLAARGDAALAALGIDDFDAATLMTERAALMGYAWNGAVSPSGRCRLLECTDGWLALNLARDEDWDLMPAWLEGDVSSQWDAVAGAVRARSAAELVERGREMGLAVALDAPPVGWDQRSESRLGFAALDPAYKGLRQPRVLDLSSLWAGPLCGDLLRRLGADVVKVESVSRPDGARSGPPLFYDRLNAGKRSVALDLRTRHGVATLRALIERADIIIDSARPRALRQLGIHAEDLVRDVPGLTWVSITGHGRTGPEADWIAYGDDAAVAAGLSHLVWQETGERAMVGDAIADPLTGIHAALAAWGAFQAGGGLVECTLVGTMRECIAAAPAGICGLSPKATRRTSPDCARPLGADTGAVVAEWDAATYPCDTALALEGESS